MKKLVLFALSVASTVAMAAGPMGGGIVIDGTSTQTATLTDTTASNEANGASAAAQQNIASNAGNVWVTGTSSQTVMANDSLISNTSNENTSAQQNLSSNSGDVSIGGTSTQLTDALNSYIQNSATGYAAKAVQSIASNSSCATCL